MEQDERLYLAPSVKWLLAPTAAALERSRDAGATRLPVLLGRRLRLAPRAVVRGDERDVRRGAPARRGPGRHITDELVEFSLSRDFGGLTPRDHAQVRRGGQPAQPFVPAGRGRPGPKVLATDARGEQALLRGQVGRGSLVLCAYPLEYMASAVARVNPDATVALTARSPPTRGCAGR